LTALTFSQLGVDEAHCAERAMAPIRKTAAVEDLFGSPAKISWLPPPAAANHLVSAKILRQNPE
jgi:hypothetical protein